MGVRSAVAGLPTEIRQELEQRLVGQGFANYAGLAEWLSQQGYEISKSAIHRFGSRFEERLEAIRLATAQAKEITNAYADDEGEVSEAALQISQGLILNMLLERGESLKANEIAMINRSIADASRAAVGLKKYQQETKARAEQAAKSVAQAAKKGGLSDEAIRQIEEQVLGIAR